MPPYTALFAWLEKRGWRPDPKGAPVFRLPDVAHPLEAADIAGLYVAQVPANGNGTGTVFKPISTKAVEGLFARRRRTSRAASRRSSRRWRSTPRSTVSCW